MNGFCSGHGLSVANSDGDDDRDRQFTLQSCMRVRRRIDFILHPAQLELKFAAALDKLDLGSDHQAICAEYKVKQCKPAQRRFRKTMKGCMSSRNSKNRPQEL